VPSLQLISRIDTGLSVCSPHTPKLLRGFVLTLTGGGGCCCCHALKSVIVFVLPLQMIIHVWVPYDKNRDKIYLMSLSYQTVKVAVERSGCKYISRTIIFITSTPTLKNNLLRM